MYICQNYDCKLVGHGSTEKANRIMASRPWKQVLDKYGETFMLITLDSLLYAAELNNSN